MLTAPTHQPEETTRLLTRLAQKPGVKSTLVLSRSTGAVVRASGLVTSDVADSQQELPNASGAPDTTLTPGAASSNEREAALNGLNGESKTTKTGTREAEEVAKLVWNFFKNAGDTVEGMFGAGAEGEGQDEVRLLRLRTRKNEVVVVPGTSAWSNTVPG